MANGCSKVWPVDKPVGRTRSGVVHDGIAPPRGTSEELPAPFERVDTSHEEQSKWGRAGVVSV